MSNDYTFRNVSQALPALCQDLLERGDEVGSRNGRVKELLNVRITLTHPWEREVLSLGRKANIFAGCAETMWLLAGRNDIEWLSAYLPRAVDYSDDGETWRAGYGPRIRNNGGVDQLARVIDLLKRDPLSRQAVIQIWDVSDSDPEPLKDRACNTQLQFQSRLGALHLTVTVRSNDVMWGWSGINAFEWSTLQEIVAHLLGNNVGTLTFNIGSLHLYQQHWDKARRIEYEDTVGDNIPFNMPDVMDRTLEWVDILIDRWFAWEGMCRQGQATPAFLDQFEEPLFQAWAAAIAYFWQREDHWLNYFRGTALAVAVARTPTSVLSETPQTPRSTAPGVGHNLAAHERTRAFYEFVKDLHAVKHASYGDSWKKRGEKMSILANMARKVDRLGVGDEFDSSADTLVDLLVYAIKYLAWIEGSPTSGPSEVNFKLGYYLSEAEEVSTEGWDLDITYSDIVDAFNNYTDNVDAYHQEVKTGYLADLIATLAPIARDLWYAENNETPGGINNPLCRFCGSAKSNHVPGGSRWTCQSQQGFQPVGHDTDEYRGADVD